MARFQAISGPDSVHATWWHCGSCGWAMVSFGEPDACEQCGEQDMEPEEPGQTEFDALDELIRDLADAVAGDCDTCPKPGACCTGFPLLAGDARGDFKTKLDAIVWSTGQSYSDPTRTRVFLGLPFLPIGPSQDMPDVWLWACVDLLPTGRCGNYENRPYGPCVNYEPGQDRLCAHHPEHEPYV